MNSLLEMIICVFQAYWDWQDISFTGYKALSQLFFHVQTEKMKVGKGKKKMKMEKKKKNFEHLFLLTFTDDDGHRLVNLI